MFRRRKGPSDDWVFDSVVGYLCCPEWQVPLDNFIDEHCLVFDGEEENKLAYTDIHCRYRGM